MTRNGSGPTREPRPPVGDAERVARPGATGDEPGLGSAPEPAGLHGSPGRLAFVVVLTIAVMVFAVLIAVWMYWLGGQLPALPAGSMPTS
jgi:hypothetical protein